MIKFTFLLAGLVFMMLCASSQINNYNGVRCTDPSDVNCAGLALKRTDVHPSSALATISCSDGKFWAIDEGGVILEFQVLGNAITFLDTLFTNAPMSSLAYCNLLNPGTIPTTFYGSGTKNVSYYDGTAWQTFSTAVSYYNSGGRNNFLYFMGGGGNTQIDRYNGSTFQTIYALSGTSFDIADLAVDNNGTVYTMIGSGVIADSLVAIDSSGVLLRTYILNPPINVNNAYGCFLIDSTFYIGLGISNPNYPKTLLPIQLSGNNASEGFPLSFPLPGQGNYLDLASCGSQLLAPPVAGFNAGDTALCQNDCIAFTNLSSNATSWQWYFQGATPSSSTDPNPQTVCYLTAGDFDVKLVAINSGGTDSITLTNYIHVDSVPPLPIIIQVGSILYCNSDSIYISYQWYDSTAIIPGATDTMLIINQGGNYNIQVTNKNGCKIAVGINIVLGTELYAGENSFSLYPNPATNQLTIQASSIKNEHATISIINVIGQEALSSSLSFGEGRGEAIDISRLAPGIYFLQLKSKNSNATKMFVKE